MPYWIQSSLAATPALAWMFLVVGLPWALAILPRTDWRDRALVACLTLALGPMLLTAWMFVLGIWGAPLLRLETILGGTAVLGAVGLALVWRKRRLPASADAAPPLAWDEKLLIGLISAALVIRWLGTAYWPFTAYDALWVYGYQGRLYTLLGQIPASIGYYPQFLPLQYTFLQLAAGGIDDHAARAVLPWLHLGSILTAYILGARLFTRRAGLFTAAIWALYPHVGAWSRFGDLEIPLTFLFTAAAAFFLKAWLETAGRRRSAFVAGLLLGAGMWTKPTMGAFIWGAALLLALELVRARFDLRAARPRLEVIVIMAAVCLPLGAAWYVRNLLLGHPVITFPTSFWLTLAARSGAEFGWPLLALLALLGGIYLWPGVPDRPNARGILIGLALTLAGLLPSILVPARMGLLEWLALAAGAAVLFQALAAYFRRLWAANADPLLSAGDVARLGWALALALPYFITWFYSYSYHYRLSFPIVPLLILPTALIAARWTAATLSAGRGALPAFYRLALVVLALPGIVIPLYDGAAGWDWLWSDELPDDFSRYASGNAALMSVVQGLANYEREQGKPLVVVAPGVVRLPFFFPLADIRTQDAPTRLDQIADAAYFVYGVPETRGAYADLPFQRNQVVGGLALAAYDDPSKSIMRKAWWHDDGNFNYTVYELHLGNRFRPPFVHAPTPEGEVVFGEFARLLGHDIGGLELWPGRRVILHLYWQALKTPASDQMVFIHLRDSQDRLWATWDGPVTRSADGTYYSTLVWEPGEYIIDERRIGLDKLDMPPGDGYRIVIGMYDLATQQRASIRVNGEPVGDSYLLTDRIVIQAQAP